MLNMTDTPRVPIGKFAVIIIATKEIGLASLEN